MLVVDLTWAYKGLELPAAGRIAIGNVGGGRLANYVIEAYGREDVLPCRTELRRYPRWAEPVSDLVGRSVQRLSTALPDCHSGRTHVVTIARTSLVPNGKWSQALRLASMPLTVDKNHFVRPARIQGTMQMGVARHITRST